MKTRNSLLWLGVPLALLAFGSAANAATEGRQVLPNLDCETLKGQDYSTMDLYALQEKWGACFRTITVAYAEKAAEKVRCDHEGHRHMDRGASASENLVDGDAVVAEPRRKFRPSNVNRKHRHKR